MRGVLCGSFEMLDSTTGVWDKVTCWKCIDHREKHKNDRQKKCLRRKAERAEAAEDGDECE